MYPPPKLKVAFQVRMTLYLGNVASLTPHPPPSTPSPSPHPHSHSPLPHPPLPKIESWISGQSDIGPPPLENFCTHFQIEATLANCRCWMMYNKSYAMIKTK